MQDKTLWLDALNDEDIRKNIAYSIVRFGTTKTVDGIYQNPRFAKCRTGNAVKDRKAIRSAIQVCNPKNKDRFNTQKYGGAVADAVRDQYEFVVAEHVPNLDQSFKRMQHVDDMAVEAETIEDLKRLKLRQQIHDKHRSALSSLAGAVQLHRRPADEADANSAQSKPNPGDTNGELPEAPKSLRDDSTTRRDSK